MTETFTTRFDHPEYGALRLVVKSITGNGGREIRKTVLDMDRLDGGTLSNEDEKVIKAAFLNRND